NCDMNAPAEPLQFRTASNRTLDLTEELRQRAAMLMADLEAVEEASNALYEIKSKAISESVQFRSASNKTIEVSNEMQQAAKFLLADIEMGNAVRSENDYIQSRNTSMTREDDTKTNASILEERNRLSGYDLPPSEDKNYTTTLTVSENTENRRNTLIPSEDGQKNTDQTQCLLSSATPQPTKLAAQCNLAFETPKCTPELQVSLTQLSEISPLDNATKSSIITRRNLLSLNKRRKSKKDAENVDASQTPMRQCFTPMATATSTPMPSRQEKRKEPQDNLQCNNKERRYSQDSPNVQRERVGKRRSEEALSPIYAPTNKTRRLGLSRIRNKSTHNI
ncbi:hypothetical protein KR093_002662, partial [Drosophila rubida]